MLPMLMSFQFSLLFFSCSTPDDIFRLKGKFKNINQGELSVYSLYGGGSIDTIRLNNGKFTYEILQEDTALLSVVFPNYSEIPVIAVPGSSVDMQGDASHLREVKVNGTDDNDELTKFRLQVAEQTPPEAVKTAAKFIEEHPASLGSIYVLNRFFLIKSDPDYAKADELLSLMVKASPGNVTLQRLQKQVEGLRNVRNEGGMLPDFSALTTKGKRVTKSDLKGELNIVSTWASWDVNSQAVQRELQKLSKKYGQRLQLLSVSLDANLEECKKTAERDSMTWFVVCDGKMWSSPVLGQLGLTAIPENIVTDRSGKIIARGLPLAEIRKTVEKRLK